MDIISKYTEFILQNLEIPTAVELPEIRDDNSIWYIKLGMPSYISTAIDVKEHNTRFLVFNVRFDKYTETLTLYVSRKKGPETLINEFHRKLKTLVWDTLINNKEFDLIRTMNRNKKIAFKIPGR